MDNESCKTCYFRASQHKYVVNRAGDQVTGTDENICRRYPPTVLAMGYSSYEAFPVVQLTSWCGEWKDKLSH